ncbi:MAG: MFS transporter [Gemmatimonadaceae bacterium]|jgi:DHA1 family tetracycline resistance protein-like MFS transporter|nr:MFS transporter [Gemmatimonadaceae bacterium]
MITLFLVVFLDLVGFGMIIPVFPFYAEQVGVNPASVIFYLGLYSLGQLVGAPIWGSLSDRIGRRPVLLVTLLANAAASSMLAFSTTESMLVLSRIVAGLAAGNISAAYAYTTDITTDETRPRALGLLGSAFGLGFILGPALGGLLAGGNESDPNALARVAHGAAVMSIIAFVLTLFRLPESLPPAKRAQGKAKRGSMTAYLKRPVLRDLLLATVIVVASVALFQSTLALWTADRLGVGPRTLGWIYGFVGVISVAVQAGIIGKLTKRFGAASLTRTGALLIGIGMAGLPLVHAMPWLLVALAVFGVGSALFNPSMSGLVATAAAPHERGAVLGAYQGAASLGRVIGPFAASGVARIGTLSWPFVLGAAVSLLGVVLIHTRPKGTGDQGRRDA